MKPCSPKYYYPVDVGRIAVDVVRLGIDLAPTRISWYRLANCVATIAGESGREAFHMMAAVWPDYSRHDSELCFTSQLRRAGQVGMGYLASLLKKHGIDINHPRYRRGGRPVRQRINQPQTKKVMKLIEFNIMLRTILNNRSPIGRNPLIDLLLRVFPQQEVINACNRYLIGFQSFNTGTMGDALIFWQVNEHKIIVNGKKIFYKFDGHRDKKYSPMVMYPENPQCLFGLHLLKEFPDKKVAIVESEKSALIMSIVMPEYLWMACGSLSNFSEKFLLPLRKRQIVGFPDLDSKRDKVSNYSISAAQWIDTRYKLNSAGWNVRIDLNLEYKATTPMRLAKEDIADVALREATAKQINRLKRQL